VAILNCFGIGRLDLSKSTVLEALNITLNTHSSSLSGIESLQETMDYTMSRKLAHFQLTIRILAWDEGLYGAPWWEALATLVSSARLSKLTHLCVAIATGPLFQNYIDKARRIQKVAEQSLVPLQSNGIHARVLVFSEGRLNNGNLGS
jgi:hypothetical protein